MKRISTATAVQNRFVDGNKLTGQKATQFSAEWCNQVQEEIAGLLESNGVTLGESENQLAELFAKVFLQGFLGIRLSQERGVAETNITPGSVNTYGGNGFEARLQGGGLLRLGGNGISIYSINGNTETLLGSILWDRENNRFNVTGALKGSDIEASGKFILAGWSFEKSQHGDLILYGNDGNAKTAVLKVYNGGTIEIIRETKFASKAVFGNVIDGTVPPNGQKKELRTTSNLFVGKDGDDSDGNIEADGDITARDITAHGNVNVDSRIVSGNVLLAISDVDLTGSPYNGSGYAIKTEMTIANSIGTDYITVTYGTGETVVLPKHTARKFIKIDTSLWIQLDAYDPQAH